MQKTLESLFFSRPSMHFRFYQCCSLFLCSNGSKENKKNIYVTRSKMTLHSAWTSRCARTSYDIRDACWSFIPARMYTNNIGVHYRASVHSAPAARSSTEPSRLFTRTKKSYFENSARPVPHSASSFPTVHLYPIFFFLFIADYCNFLRQLFLSGAWQFPDMITNLERAWEMYRSFYTLPSSA